MESGRFAVALAALLLAASCGEKAGSPAAGTDQPGAPRPQAGSLEWAVAGAWRIDAEKARDQWRHPVETLAFFGLKNSDTVIEIFPGGGWYTAILGPWLRSGGGKLYAAHPDPASSDSARANVDAYTAAFVAHPDVYGAIEVTVASEASGDPAASGGSPPPASGCSWMLPQAAARYSRDAIRTGRVAMGCADVTATCRVPTTG